ncbi:unnamed protein product [Calicophoron daubneyi]|uniref:Anosmin-1 n=1 Tax=Calicophoron daubneyi TaxID=300641 RepID=A0AAV2TTU2_CALDB
MEQYFVRYITNVFIILCLHLCVADKQITSPLEERLFLRAQCKAKCLRLFQDSEEQANLKIPWQPAQTQREILHYCFKNISQICSSECFTTCDQPPTECVSSCSHHGIGCHLGCMFLLNSVEPRPGQCPVDLDSTIPHKGRTKTNKKDKGNPAPSQSFVCARSCRSDGDCTDPLHKCCTVGCDQICVPPQFNQSTPPLAPQLKSKIFNSSSLSMELEWSSPFSQLLSTTGPIVFVLQTRICMCKRWNQSYVTEWQTLVMTHQFQAKIDSFEPGKMYEFRIAAVGTYGTRGFGPPSSPYPPVPVSPSPPSPPQNLTDTMWRFYSTGTLSTLLSWESPKQSDLPVSEYLVSWVTDHGFVQSGGHSIQGLTQFSQSIPPDQFRYIIQNLKPSTSYKVQVQALSYWHGYGHLRSQPNTIFLSTQSIHPVYKASAESDRAYNVLSDQQESSLVDPSDCDCGESISRTTSPIRLTKVVYDHGELTANFFFTPPNKDVLYQIEWFPQACINSRENEPIPAKARIQVSGRKNSVLLNRLNFNCRYSVRIQQVHEKPAETETNHLMLSGPFGKTGDWSAFSCFCTPSCVDVDVSRGSTPPEDCPLPEPGPPLPPSNLNVQKMSAMIYRISWKSPHMTERRTRTIPGMGRRTETLSDPHLTKYRVLWAPRINEPVSMEMYNDKIGFSPIMDYQRSDVRVVEQQDDYTPLQNRTWLELRDLDGGTLYIVRVQTLTSAGTGYDRESPPASLYFLTSSSEELERPNTDLRKKKTNFLDSVGIRTRFSRSVTLTAWPIVLLLYRRV